MSKIITSYEISLLAKEATEKFLIHNIPLDDTISKIASEQDFNFEQLSRIAEESNTLTQLHLYNQAPAENRYIEFPTADIKKIASRVREKQKEASQLSVLPKFNDYFLPPATTYIPAPSQTINEHEKTATIIEDSKESAPPVKGPLADQFQKLHKTALDKLYQNSVQEIGFAIEKHANDLINIAKQDILSGDGSYAEMELVFQSGLSTYPKIAGVLLSHLPKDKNVIKIAGVLDQKHWFYKEVEKLAFLIGEYEQAKIDPAGAHKKIAKLSPKLMLGIGLPTAGLLGLGLMSANKAHNEAKNSTLTIQNPAINKVN